MAMVRPRSPPYSVARRLTPHFVIHVSSTRHHPHQKKNVDITDYSAPTIICKAVIVCPSTITPIAHVDHSLLLDDDGPAE